jgi:hypothetical protein
MIVYLRVVYEYDGSFVIVFYGIAIINIKFIMQYYIMYNV